MINNIISEIGCKVELLFVEPVKEMEVDITATFSSSSTTSNYPSITIISNSVNKDVTINETSRSVLKILEKSNNNNKLCNTSNITQLNISQRRRDFTNLLVWMKGKRKRSIRSKGKVD